MGKSAPAAPPAPDYKSAAEATATGNLEAAKYATEANRINQYTPYGSLTYNQSPDGKWSQTETYDPRVQSALDSQIGVQQGLSNQANSMLGTVNNSYSQPFNPVKLSSFLGGIGSVNTGDLGSAGQFSSNASLNPSLSMNGVNGVEQNGVGTAGNFLTNSRVNTDAEGAAAGAQGLNQNYGRFAGDGSGVNTNAPQFDPNQASQYSKAAYDAQMSLLQPGMDQQETKLRNSLALQGLTPGSEANTNAMGEFNTGRTQQLNNLSAQSVLTGNQIAQGNYASQLAGFNAGNSAVGQQFGQNLSGFTANQGAMQNENAGRTQQLSNYLAQFQAGNQAQGQAFGQDSTNFTNNLQATMANNQLQQARNAAQQQAFDQNTSVFNTNNNAQLNQFGMDQSKYSTQLAGLTTNAGLQQAQNQAQAQQYAQALQNYGTQWQQDQTLRNMPLNELNALLTGQQVQNPQFQNYALQGQTNGADMLGAAQGTAQYNQGVYNAGAASANSGNQATAGLAGAAMTAAAIF